MAEAQSTSAGGAGENGNPAQLPSYEEQRRSAPVLLSEEAQRIRWRLNGPLTTAITVMEHPRIDPGNAVFEPYYHGLGGNGVESWHPFSQSPYTTPKVSSVTIWVDPLDEWISHWLQQHQFHVREGDYNPATTRFGPLPGPGEERDDVTSYEEETGRRLEACCGSERPVNKGTKVVVRAATGGFLTIHDFLSTVHPYLMNRRADIVAAMHAEQYRGIPVPAEDGLFVDPMYSNPHSLTLMDEAEWLKNHRKPGLRVAQDAATQARLRHLAPKMRASSEQAIAILQARQRAAEAATRTLSSLGLGDVAN
ncbi:hypothetical protein CONLIGDRAFT_389466 [Coniochaeta ligniaria NRRL 30616]|uniref:Uncharacterized protein n=1 Tax=Coniochaeta ligniaria NRRL 30616 TaxID=1408157 RepID=A0A1J7IN75_9PEZI|nr:hypothetical protein CONLIGDRAFT_389466 [Coniochaeta ligniaria NRRL 30616]